MKSIIVLSLFVVCALSSAVPLLLPNAEYHFQNFLDTYGKMYTPEEYVVRYGVFQKNLAEIDQLNAADPYATFGVTPFTDLSSEEFREQMLMKNFNPPAQTEANTLVRDFAVDALPASFDWRDKNAVTPVKNQGQCGSCWAFSTVEEIESQWILKGHPAVQLSPQQIVDCDKVDKGCNGGDPPRAYQYVISAGGLETGTEYPYTARDGTCHATGTKAVKISSWKYAISNRNEVDEQNALYTDGPLSICVDAATWQNYRSGVITANCGTSLDHCVLLTGWGADSATGVQYWSIRNSWGTAWGESGYLRVERGHDLCGVAQEVTLAVV